MVQQDRTGLPVVNMLWIGAELGMVEHLAMISYMKQGHTVRLYVYDTLDSVPNGVELLDAGQFMPFDIAQSLWVRHNGGSWALASDYFRLKLMQAGAGLWSDTDMICLHPIRHENSPLFGWESTTSINTALLYLEPGSPIVADVLAALRPSRVPYWMPLRRQLKWWGRRLRSKPFDPTSFRWGMYGPEAMTALAKRYRITHRAQPVDVFYPVPLAQWQIPFSPNSSFDQFITERTKAIHLWHSRFGGSRPPSSSAIGKLAASLGA